MGEIVFMAMHSWGLGEQDEFPATPHGASWRQRMLVSSWGTPFSLGTAQWVKRLRSARMVKPMQRLQNWMPQKISGLVLSKPDFPKSNHKNDLYSMYPWNFHWEIFGPLPFGASRVSRFGGQVPGAAAEHLREVDPLCTEEVGESAGRAPSQAGWMAWMGGSWAEKDTPLVSTGRVPDSQWPTLEKNHPN